jgi:phage-related protein
MINKTFTTHVFDLAPGTVNVFTLQTISFSGGEAPESHIEDSKKLDADAYIELFEITLSDKTSTIYLKANNDVTWQGNTYEGTGVKLDGVASYSDDETSRPKLTVYNPEGIYSSLINNGLLDNAKITRIRVLKQHIDSDSPISRRQQWRVSRVANLRKNMIGLELRDMMDGQFFMSPGRMYIPPEFPQVSLQ